MQAITQKEKALVSGPTMNADSDQRPPQYLSSTASAALMTSDTSSRKASTSTSQNDSNRVRNAPMTPDLRAGATCHISSRLSLSSANAVVAPTSKNKVAIKVANCPSLALRAPATSVCIACAPLGPTKRCSCAKISPWAACSPKKAPAMAMTKTRIGAMENSVKNASAAPLLAARCVIHSSIDPSNTLRKRLVMLNDSATVGAADGFLFSTGLCGVNKCIE